jgi:hypothetical protein
VRTVVIVVVLPFAKLLVEQPNVVGNAVLVKELIELLVVHPVRPLDLVVEMRRSRPDVDMPRADGSVSSEQRPEADVVIEYLRGTAFATASQQLAWVVKQANDAYATDYPARVGDRMAATDSNAFSGVVAAISLRENESTVQINNGWDPHHHRPTDLYSAFSDKDFRLGLNAAQSTLAAVAHLTGATVKP